MNEKGIIRDSNNFIPETHAVHDNAKSHERRKIQITKTSFKGVEHDAESSNILGSKELLWIRMLKHSRISDDKIKEIVTEWVSLIKKINEVSHIF